MPTLALELLELTCRIAPLVLPLILPLLGL